MGSGQTTQTRLREKGSGVARAVSRRWARLPVDPVPVLIMVVAGLVLSDRLGVVREWHVMTDELLYPKLAQGVLDGHVFPGWVRGEPSGARSLLFPYLMAPWLATMPVPEAYRAIIAMNAWLFASAAIPAFLLARSVLGRRQHAYLVAAMVVAVPWATEAANVLTEATAYAAFTWALWAMHRALVRRTAAADLLAVALLVVAYLARTQFVVLVPLLPLAALLHETALHVAERLPGEGRWRSLRSLPGPLWRSHRVLWTMSVAGAVYAIGGADTLLGSYASAGQGGLLPAGIVDAIWPNVAYIAIGLGALPLALAISWVSAQLLRPSPRAAHAFAVLAALVVPVLVLVTTSFDIRFSIGAFLQERYLFYIAPAILVCFAAFFTARRSIAWTLAGGIAAGYILSRTSYTGELIAFASPEAAFYPVLHGRSEQIASLIGWHPDITTFLQLTVPIAAVAVGLLLRWLRWRAFLAVGGLTLAFMVAQLDYIIPPVLADLETPTAGIFGPRTDEQRSWVDRATAEGDRVGLLGGAVNARGDGPYFNVFVNQAIFWDVEFWNRRIDVVWDAGTLPPVYATKARWQSGTLELPGPVRPTHLVMSSSDLRFAPQGDAVAAPGYLTLYRLAYGPRLAWMSKGIGTDGWTDPSRPSLIKVYARPGDPARVWRLDVLGYTGNDVPGGRAVSLRFGRSRARTTIVTTGELVVRACVPAGGARVARLLPEGSSQLDTRRVGIRVIRIVARPTARIC